MTKEIRFMSETINSNIQPGFPNTLVDEVGELNVPVEEEKPKRAKKRGKESK